MLMDVRKWPARPADLGVEERPSLVLASSTKSISEMSANHTLRSSWKVMLPGFEIWQEGDDNLCDRRNQRLTRM